MENGSDFVPDLVKHLVANGLPHTGIGCHGGKAVVTFQSRSLSALKGMLITLKKNLGLKELGHDVRPIFRKSRCVQVTSQASCIMLCKRSKCV